MTVYDIIQEAGWLTWEEYCYLIVASSWHEGGGLLVYDWAKSPKRLAKELRLLKSILQYLKVKLYVLVLKKVMKQFLWETEMTRNHPEAMHRRSRDAVRPRIPIRIADS
jgi:hypothetical protein